MNVIFQYFSQSTRQCFYVVSCTFIFLLLHGLVDARLNYHSSANAAFAAADSALLSIVFVIVCITAYITLLSSSCARFRINLSSVPYVVLAGVVSVCIIACHISGILAAAYNPDREVVSAVQYIRITSIISIMANRHGLRPAKVWFLIAVGGFPLLLQPLGE